MSHPLDRYIKGRNLKREVGQCCLCRILAPLAIIWHLIEKDAVFFKFQTRLISNISPWFRNRVLLPLLIFGIARPNMKIC